MNIEALEGYIGNRAIVPLHCLVPDHDFYRLMILQADGPMVGTPDRVGHNDVHRGHALVESFLLQAKEEVAELVVTPEYSTPWSIVLQVATTDLRPAPGDVWILGCESLASDKLLATAQSFRDAGCLVIHEPLDAGARGFLDVAMYVLWTESEHEGRVLTLVMQFKTIASADDMEHRALVCGSRVYTINRRINSIALTTFICSDVFNLLEPQIADLTNTLVVHIQLNPKPANDDYKRYRDHLARVISNKDVHIICLNWAGNLSEWKNGREKRWGNNAGSALYVPPHKFSCDQTLIEDAHTKGLYYSRVGKWHGFFVDQEPHALLLQMEKVHEHNVPTVLQRGSLVRIVGRWTWDDHSLFAVSNEADSGYGKLASAGYPAAYAAMRDAVRESPVGAERALELLLGRVTLPTWYEIGSLRSFEVAAAESLQRATVHQDNNTTSAGTAFRKATWQRAQDAATLPGQAVPWPKPLSSVSSGFRFAWQKEHPHFNITILNDGKRATLVYLGENSDEEVVKFTHRVLLTATRTWLAQSAANDDEMAKAGDRICIVYRKDHEYRVWGARETSKIDSVADSEPFDFTGG